MECNLKQSGSMSYQVNRIWKDTLFNIHETFTKGFVVTSLATESTSKMSVSIKVWRTFYQLLGLGDIEKMSYCNTWRNILTYIACKVLAKSNAVFGKYAFGGVFFFF